jgi:hypothetical protein
MESFIFASDREQVNATMWACHPISSYFLIVSIFKGKLNFPACFYMSLIPSKHETVH